MNDWVSAHAFYQGDLDDLITEAVAPLMAELAADDLAAGWFFLRYWEGGPHLRLRVLSAEQTKRATVEDRISKRFAWYFHDHPSADRVSQDEYAKIARELARWERVDSYTERIHPNNSLSFISYRREHERYGDGRSIDAVERHFVESSRIASGILTAGAPVDRRVTAAGAMILLAWFACESDPAELSRLIGAPEDVVSDPIFGVDAATQAKRDRAETLARQMRSLAMAAPGLTETGSLADWARSVSTLRDELVAGVMSGAFTPPTRGWDGAGAGAIAQSADPGARVLPVLDICAHLICNRLGVLPTAEGALRSVLADAVTMLAQQERSPAGGLA